MTRLSLLAILCLLTTGLFAQTENVNTNPFRQLYTELPTPNVYRNAAGAPGHKYWQQQADYEMDIRLDDETQRIYGTSNITYHNNSPDALDYLWVQLDQNVRAKDSDTYKVNTSSIRDRMTLRSLAMLEPTFDGGFKIDYVKDAAGKMMKFTIVKTMMRVEIPGGLAPGGQTELQFKW